MDEELFDKIHKGEGEKIPQRTIEGKNKPEKNYDEFRESVLIQLASNKKGEASEEVVRYILENYKIYTTRDDEKSEMWIYEEGIYAPHGKTHIKEECRNILKEAYTTYFGNQVIAKIETDTYIDHDVFFNNTYVDRIAVENGILNIHTRKLEEFTTEKIFFNKIPIIYDPSKECSNIKKHFCSVLKKGDISTMEELFGYLLLKEYRFEKAFMFTGEGRNGKGKTLELMKRFLGIENCTNISLYQLENENFALGELFNKMANLAGDIERTALKRTSILSGLTGRDMQSAARKFLNRVNFTNYAKMIFCANELPVVYNNSDAFWNRWILIDFPYTFLSEKEYGETEDKEKYKLMNPNIIDEIINPDEMSGLLNLALDGLKRLMKNKEFSLSQSTEEIKEIWMRKSDSFLAFLMDYIDEDYNSKIEKKELKNVYVSFCRKNNLKICSEKVMKIILTTNTAVTEARILENGERKYFWEGIKLKNKTVCAQGGEGDHGIYHYTKKPIRGIEGKTIAKHATLATSKNSSDDLINFILALDGKKTDWQTLSAKFGEDAVQKAIDKNRIYEPMPNQIKVLEEN